MKSFQICLFLIVVCSATVSLGQYGLYGSPDTIQMSQQPTNVVPSGNYANGSSSYTAPTNYGSQRPVSSYAAQQQPYASQPTQQYVAQQAQIVKPAATYGQMGPQYSTPAYSNPTYTAAANQSVANQPAAVQPVMPSSLTMPGPQMAPGVQNPTASEPAAAPGMQQNNGMMNQMLADQGQGSSGYASGSENGALGAGQCGAYQPYVNSYEQSAGGNCYDGCTETSLWYASISALAMSRDRPNKVYITYETGNLPHNDYPVDEIGWRFGGEVRFGRRFCGGCNGGYWALEASYWTLGNFQSDVSHTSPATPITNPYGTVGTPLRVSDIEFGGQPGTNWFDHAQEHHLWRRDEVHNVEANVVRGQWCYGQESPWDLGFALGVRYFRFHESWRFGSLMGPAPTDPPPVTRHTWGEADGLYEAYLSDQITNDLIGPQLSFELGYNMWQNFRFYLAPKVGIYNNHITNNFQAALGNDVIATTGSSGVPGTYPVDSATNKLAFLTQVDVGFDWKFAQQWTARFGYRMVSVSGVGLADAQIPFYIVDIPAIADIDKNGDLIMHGAFVTLAYNF